MEEQPQAELEQPQPQPQPQAPQTAELVRRHEEFQYFWREAQVAAASKLYPDVRSAEQAMGKILLGRSLGLEPTQALMGIYMVRGRPMVSATTLAAFALKAGYEYKVLEHDDTKCVIEFRRKPTGLFGPRDGDRLGVSEFTIEDAKRAGLVKPDSGWVSYPKAMLFARAMSQGVRWFAPDATLGVPIYVEGEIEEPRQTLTAPGELDYGEDEEVAAKLREAFDRLAYTPAKRRMLLAGGEPAALLRKLVGENPDALVDLTEVEEAEVVS